MIAESYRLFTCARCSALIEICGHCDRGNIYCSKLCADHRRRESLRRAGHLYQLSPRGADNHRRRQREYRRRQRVTHQGSPPGPLPENLSPAPPETATLVPDAASESTGSPEPDSEPTLIAQEVAHEAPSPQLPGMVRCSFCHRLCRPFARRTTHRCRARLFGPPCRYHRESG